MRALIASVALIAASMAAPASAQSYGNDYGYGYNGDTFRCESNDGRYRECAFGGGQAQLVRQLSKAACIEGRTWGYARGGVWVSDGCRAEFRAYAGNDYGYGNNNGYGNNGYYGNQGNGYGYGYGNGQTFRCESTDGRTRECAINTRGGVQLVRQLSKSACIEGRSWGSSRNGVWVSQGCRAEFAVGGRGNGYGNGYGNNYGNGYGNNYGYGGQTFRCESNDGRVRECAANLRSGVQLVRQLSKAACIQGRSWGYGRSGIWVSQGCRAEFRSY